MFANNGKGFMDVWVFQFLAKLGETRQGKMMLNYVTLDYVTLDYVTLCYIMLH